MPATRGHRYDALIGVAPGMWTSHQRPIMRGQTRFTGQGAMEFHRPDAEDEHVYRRYFSRNDSEPIVRNGTYVEMGAYNGVTFSNSLFFERELGWRGLLVEANPKNYADLVRTRNRSSSRNTLLHAAVGDVAGTTEVSVGGRGVQSGIVSANASNARSVPCMPLHAMLAKTSSLTSRCVHRW